MVSTAGRPGEILGVRKDEGMSRDLNTRTQLASVGRDIRGIHVTSRGKGF